MNNISRQNFALVELSQYIKLSVGLLHYVVAVHCLSEVLRKMGTEELKCRDLFNIGPTNRDFPCRCLRTSLCCVSPFHMSQCKCLIQEFQLGGQCVPVNNFSEGHFFFGRGTNFFCFFFNVPGVRISTNVIFSGFGSCFTLVIF